MRLRALSAGISAPLAHFDGRVHSVFEQACNLTLDDGRLITLLTMEQPNLPQAIRVEMTLGLNFERIGLASGQEVTARNGDMFVVDAQLEIELWFARRWHIDLSGLQADLTQPQTQAAWSAAYQALGEQRTMLAGEGLAPLGWNPDGAAGSFVLEDSTSQLAQTAYPALNNLAQATRQRDASMLPAALMPLVGLGPGLTPSCDDFLVGYLAGLWSTVDTQLPQQTHFIEALGVALENLASRTNQVSNTYIRHAVEGQVSEALATLARTIAEGDDSQAVGQATQTAVQVGSTSGADGVLGLLVGISIWQKSTTSQRD